MMLRNIYFWCCSGTQRVRDLKVVSVQNYSAVISWSPPINTNTEGVEYAISYEVSVYVCILLCIVMR